VTTYPNNTASGTVKFYLSRAGPLFAVVYATWVWLTLPPYPNFSTWFTIAMVVAVSMAFILFVGSQFAVTSSLRRMADPIEIEATHLVFWSTTSTPYSGKERAEVRFSQISSVNLDGFSRSNVVWHEGDSPPPGFKGWRVTLLTPDNARKIRHAWENWKTGKSSPSLPGTPLSGTISYDLAAQPSPASHSFRVTVGRVVMVGIGLVMIALWPAIVGPYRFAHWNGDALSFGMLMFVQGIFTVMGVLFVWKFGVRMRQGAGHLDIQDDGIRLQYPNGKAQWIPWVKEGTLFTLKDERKRSFYTGDGFIIETTASPETQIPESAFASLVQRATSKGCTVRRRVHTETDVNGSVCGEWTTFEVAGP
jgi:hypothetical protein